MRVRLERTNDGHQLVDLETGAVIFGPDHSLAKLSRFTADHRVAIVERGDAGENEKTAASTKETAASE